jgi:hypothetical protein
MEKASESGNALNQHKIVNIREIEEKKHGEKPHKPCKNNRDVSPTGKPPDTGNETNNA